MRVWLTDSEDASGQQPTLCFARSNFGRYYLLPAEREAPDEINELQYTMFQALSGPKQVQVQWKESLGQSLALLHQFDGRFFLAPAKSPSHQQRLANPLQFTLHVWRGSITCRFLR